MPALGDMLKRKQQGRPDLGHSKQHAEQAPRSTLLIPSRSFSREQVFKGASPSRPATPVPGQWEDGERHAHACSSIAQGQA